MTNDELLKKIYDDTQMMKTELTSVKETTKELAADMKAVREDTKDLRSRMSAIELNLENETNKYIRILAENHLSLMEKLDEAIKVSNRHFLYELKVSSLDRRVTEIERRIQS